MSGIKFVGQQDVPVDDLKPHPDNPNRGSVDDLQTSLEQFGQFRSIVATKDLTILAGHHLWQAAKELGYKTMRVDILDVDDKTGRKIMLADNRLADLGMGPDLDLLLKNLEELHGDIAGTGFDEEYLRMLEDAIQGPPDLEELEREVDEKPPSPTDFFKRITLLVDPREQTRWERHRAMFPDDNEAFRYLLVKNVQDSEAGDDG